MDKDNFRTVWQTLSENVRFRTEEQRCSDERGGGHVVTQDARKNYTIRERLIYRFGCADIETLRL